MEMNDEVARSRVVGPRRRPAAPRALGAIINVVVVSIPEREAVEILEFAPEDQAQRWLRILPSRVEIDHFRGSVAAAGYGRVKPTRATRVRALPRRGGKGNPRSAGSAHKTHADAWRRAESAASKYIGGNPARQAAKAPRRVCRALYSSDRPRTPTNLAPASRRTTSAAAMSQSCESVDAKARSGSPPATRANRNASDGMRGTTSHSTPEAALTAAISAFGPPAAGRGRGAGGVVHEPNSVARGAAPVGCGVGFAQRRGVNDAGDRPPVADEGD